VNAKKKIFVLGLASALLVLSETVIAWHKNHSGHAMLPGTHFILGFFGAALLLALAKLLSHNFLSRPEDYYDE